MNLKTTTIPLSFHSIKYHLMHPRQFNRSSKKKNAKPKINRSHRSPFHIRSNPNKLHHIILNIKFVRFCYKKEKRETGARAQARVRAHHSQLIAVTIRQPLASVRRHRNTVYYITRFLAG